MHSGDDHGCSEEKSFAHEARQSPYTTDKASGELRRSHHIDLKSGKYRGKQILEPKMDV
jgi:large subunit ribosomal protein L32